MVTQELREVGGAQGGRQPDSSLTRSCAASAQRGAAAASVAGWWFEGRAISRRCHEAWPQMRAQAKMEARSNQPQATEGLLDTTPVGWQPRCSTQERAVFLPDAENTRQLCSCLESILNVARGYASGAFVGCGLADGRFEHPART